MSSRPSAFLSLLSLILLVTYSSARADETVILKVIVNQEDKGEYFLIMRNDGDFFIKTEDLKTIGFKEIEGDVYDIEGDLYVLLSSIRGIEFKLNEVKLSLEITALPFHFPKQVIDLERRLTENVRYPSDTSAFFNYSLQYTQYGSDSTTELFEMVNELGIRRGTLLFLTDSDFTRSGSDDQLVRLTTSVTHDRRPQLQRLVIGDFIAPANNFGVGLNMGGLLFYKAYETAPDLITHPLIGFSGSTDVPSDLEVYLDGRLYRTEKLHPGDFDLRNLFPREGGGLMEVVIRDAFGREQRFELPYYLSTTLLREGYQNYSYGIGFLREQFGIESNEYGDLALSGYHFYGINNQVTAGIYAQTSRGRYNLGPAVSMNLWNAGILSMTMAASQDGDRNHGYAESAQYVYQSRRYSVFWTVRGFSRDYVPINQTASVTGTRLSSLTGFGYNTRTLGSFGLGFELDRYFEGPGQRIITVRYSRTLFRQMRMITEARFRRNEENIQDYYVTFVYTPVRKTTVSTNYSHQDGFNTESVRVDNAPPFGQGYGGRASYKRTDSDTESTDSFDGFLQYNARHGTYIGRYQSAGSNWSYQLSAAGGIAYVDRSVFLGRPVTDSFALVEVGNLKDVRVYVNNNEVGRTDSKGRLFVPDIASYYTNQISINDHDISMDYSFPNATQLISPPGRSGSTVIFEASKYRAIFGKIMVGTETGPVPLKLYEASMNVEGTPLTFQTTSDGEFYIEGIYAGAYEATVIYHQKPCVVHIVVPDTDETLIDLGELNCENSD